jgi:hypothetical protein
LANVVDEVFHGSIVAVHRSDAYRSAQLAKPPNGVLASLVPGTPAAGPRTRGE